MYKTGKRKFVGILTLLLLFEVTHAQIVLQEESYRRYYDITDGRRVTKFKDMRNFRDVFHVNKYMLGKNRIFGNISYNTGRILVTDDRQEIHEEWRQAIGFYTRYRFFEEFSINSTFFIDFNKRASMPWVTDYSYSIGRYAWKPKKFNFGYENYINNKYSDNLATMGEKFLEGYYFLSYQHLLPEKWNKAIRIDNSTMFKFLWFTRYAIHYRDEQGNTYGSFFHGKPSIGVASRFTIFWNIYVEGAVYYYLIPGQRAPWDPDYSYGFGYFDWRSFRLSLTYGNWAINRFNPVDKRYPNYGFVDGQFRIIANWTW